VQRRHENSMSGEADTRPRRLCSFNYLQASSLTILVLCILHHCLYLPVLKASEAYTDAQGPKKTWKARVSRNVLERTRESTRRGLCCVDSWARKPPREVP